MYYLLTREKTNSYLKKRTKKIKIMGTFKDTLEQQLGNIAGGGIGTALSAGMGLLLGGYNDRRQIEMQQKLTDMQLTANAKMAGLNHDLQLKLWNETSYPAQLAKMKEAGLNPALMYGGTGSGGTTGAASGSGVSGSQAMRQSEILDLNAQIMQMQLMKSEQKVNESIARKNNIEADYTAGAKTEETNTNIRSVIANTTNTEEKTKLIKLEQTGQEIQNKIQNELKQSGMITEKLIQEVNAVKENYKQTLLQNNITERITETIIKQYDGNLNNTVLEGLLTQQKINLTKKQTWAMNQEIQQGWKKLSIEERNAVTNYLNYTVNRSNANTNETNANTNKLNAQTKLGEMKLQQIQTETYRRLSEKQGQQIQQNIDWKAFEVISDRFIRFYSATTSAAAAGLSVIP